VVFDDSVNAKRGPTMNSPAMNSSTMNSQAIGTVSVMPRGFTVNRADGRPQLPGSLHTNRKLGQWLSFDCPSIVRVFTGKAELGQGILTALRLIVADELDLALEAVKLESASTARGPDEAVTSGSLSIQDSGSALHHVCAEVRALAIAAVSLASGVPNERIIVENGFFLDRSNKEVIGDYWTALAGENLDREYMGTAIPKAVDQRRLLGSSSVPRLDLPDKVFGKLRFIHDLKFPDMIHARVVRPPRLTSELACDPAVIAAELPSSVQFVMDGRFMAIVGLFEHEVERAAARFSKEIQWTKGSSLPDLGDLASFLRTAPCEVSVPAQRSVDGTQDKGPEAWPDGGQRFAAEYLKPYLAHASIGLSCALAQWAGGRLEVWTHSQGIHNLRDDIMLALSQDDDAPKRDDIVIHHVEAAGCYGHNGADDVAFDAVLIARACPGKVVKLRWSRADELTHSPFGAAQLARLEARVDQQGQITHWQHSVWANGYSSRPGRATTPSLLAASERLRSTPLPLPVNPPLAMGGGADRNAVPGYALPNFRLVNHRLTVMPLRTSAMRALGAFLNVMAIESFMDEMALSLGQDRVDFRRRHLQDSRALAVIDLVLSRSSFWNDQLLPRGNGFGQGFGWARYKNSGAWCAAIARVEVTDHVRVTDIELAVDVGAVVDRDGVLNQIEGGAIQSVSWTIKEQVKFDSNELQCSDWNDYPILRMNEIPRVSVHLIDRPEQISLGAGEAAQGPVAAAVVNAVSEALGLRIRQLPLSPDNLLRAVHAAPSFASEAQQDD